MILELDTKAMSFVDDNYSQDFVVRGNYYTATEFRQVAKNDLNRLFKKHGRI